MLEPTLRRVLALVLGRVCPENFENPEQKSKSHPPPHHQFFVPSKVVLVSLMAQAFPFGGVQVEPFRHHRTPRPLRDRVRDANVGPKSDLLLHKRGISRLENLSVLSERELEGLP